MCSTARGGHGREPVQSGPMAVALGRLWPVALDARILPGVAAVLQIVTPAV